MLTRGCRGAIYRYRSDGLLVLQRAVERGAIKFGGDGMNAYMAAVRAEVGNPKLTDLLDKENAISTRRTRSPPRGGLEGATYRRV